MLSINIVKVLNVIAIVFTLIVNAMATLLPINGKTTAQLSDQYPVYFVPPGYVFSIWGIIYLGLIAFGSYQFLFKKHDDFIRKISPAFIVSSAANVFWIIAWHYEQINLSVGLMLVLLVSLILIDLMLLKHDKKTEDRAFNWMVRIPMNVYLGWISVATIANITIALYKLNWDGFGINPAIWAAVMITVAGLLALIKLLKDSNKAFALVVAWALIGIYAKFPKESVISFPAVFFGALLLTVEVYLVLSRKDTEPKSKQVSKPAKKKSLKKAKKK